MLRRALGGTLPKSAHNRFGPWNSHRSQLSVRRRRENLNEHRNPCGDSRPRLSNGRGVSGRYPPTQ